jgi:HEPN domain-containing protein
MSWLDEVNVELQRARAAERSGNSGKVRTSARRAVGIALLELQRRIPEKIYGRDFISQLRGFASDESVPEDARLAADRLQTRLSPQFESPSKNPIDDARSIIRFVTERLR